MAEDIYLMAMFVRSDKIYNTLQPGVRKDTIDSVRQWRDNWLRVGEKLHTIMHGGDYADWGYSSFSEYVEYELGIKKRLANNMILAYEYTKSKHPEILAQQDPKMLPAVDDVAALIKLADKDPDKAKEIDVKVYNGTLAGAEAKAAIREVRSPRQPDMQTEELAQVRRVAKLAGALKKEIQTFGYADDETVSMLTVCLGKIADISYSVEGTLCKTRK